MSWRGDPTIVWRDECGDTLMTEGVVLSMGRGRSHHGEAIWLPEALEDRTELLTRLADLLGLDIEVREKSRPIERGDIVEHEYGSAPMRVVHIDGDTAMLRMVDSDYPLVAAVSGLTRSERIPTATDTCTEGNRLCVTSAEEDWWEEEDWWCDEPHPTEDLACSRPFGHGGSLHVACGPGVEHNLATWGGEP